MAKALDEAAARDLITRAITSIAGAAEAKKAGPVLDALFELARQSAKVAGKRKLEITEIKVHSGGDLDGAGATTVFAADQVGQVGGTTGRVPIRYGGNGYTCTLVSKGPPPTYTCVRS